MRHLRLREHQCGWPRALPRALLAGLFAAPAVVAGSALAQTDGWQEEALAQARAVHLETLPQDCDPADIRPAGDESETAYPIRVGEEGAPRDALLVAFPCLFGAYNLVFVYVLVDQDGNSSPVLFPTPVIDVRYADGDAQSEVEAVTVTAIVDRREVINPHYDPDTQTLEAFGKWRGLGDAHDLTRWGFRDGRFQIMHFAVDASYDLEINPVVLIDEDIP